MPDAIRRREEQQLLDRRRGEFLPWAILQGLPVQRTDPSIGTLIEPGARLVPESALLNQLPNPGRQCEALASGAGELRSDMGKGIEADQIAGAERGAGGTRNERTGETVHLVDGQITLSHQTHRGHPPG